MPLKCKMCSRLRRLSLLSPVLYRWVSTLQWRHNRRDGVPNHQPPIVYSIVYSGADQRKHQSSVSLAFVLGIHRWLVNSPHKWPITGNGFHSMTSLWENIPGPLFTKSTPFYWYSDSQYTCINLGRSSDCLRFIMGLPIPVLYNTAAFLRYTIYTNS